MIEEQLRQYPAVVVANGAFPDYPLAHRLLQNAPMVVCCDGAFQTFMEKGAYANAQVVVVGDGDSLPAAWKLQYAQQFVEDKSEAYNDLQKALRYCISQNQNRVLLLGCEGKREDHFVANLSIMATYSDRLSMVMLTAHGMFHSIRQTTTFPSFPGQQVSVFCKDPELSLSFQGLKYPVHDRAFQFLWEGSLNEALGNSFTIEIVGTGTVVVYQTHP